MSVETPTAPAPATSGGRFSRKAILLGVCCVAQFMVILDLSIVNVALPTIQAALNFNTADLNWVIDAYAIVFGGFLMLAGRFGDTFGQRKAFVAALFVFSAASLLGGLAPSSLVLIIARGIQGLGGALMAATSLGIITASFAEGHERGRAIALWSSMNGIGGAAGVLLSGVITQYLSWRWVLLINVPIGAAAMTVAWAVVTDRHAAKRPRFDFAGAIVLTGGLLVEAYGAVTAGNDGWGSASALVPLIAGAIVLNFFPLIEKRAAAPLVPPGALTRQLKVVNVIVLLFSAALFPMWFIGSLYLQQVLSLSPVDTGLVFLPPALAIFFFARFAGRLVQRAGVKPVLGGGLLLMTGGLLALSRIHDGGSSIQYILIPTLLTTLGISFSIVPSTIAATQASTAERAGLSSGLVNTARQIGGGLGLAVLISIATQYTSNRVGAGAGIEQALTDGFRLGYLIGAGLCGIAAILTFVFIPSTQKVSARAPLGVLAGVALVLAVFAGYEFGAPRTHAAPIGKYALNGKVWSFASAPNLHPPKLRVDTNRLPNHQLGGYVMTTNFYDVTKAPILGQSGALMLDSQLEPVWFQPVPVQDVADNLHAQTYQGKPVLTYWQGQVTSTGLINTGQDIVVNQHYQPIAKITGQDGWTITMHEMVIKGDDAWVTVNRNAPHNLSSVGGVNNGVIVDSGVQEIDLKTGKAVYTWDALDHIPYEQSKVTLPSNGYPWDAYHINAVELESNDDMLISMRDTSAIYLVSIKTGKVIWTLGGKATDFKVPSADHFEWQHDAKLIDGGTEVSMFDDHCCDITGSGTYLAPTGPSRALVLKLDKANHTVSEVEEYKIGNLVHSEYMGNTQQLANGNTFTGWGQAPFIAEFKKGNALPVFLGQYPSPDIAYRSYLQKWVGEPLTKPSAVALKAGGVAVSWNGATQVTRWRLVSSSGQAVTTTARDGFETDLSASGSVTGDKVQALNASGAVIGTSNPIQAAS
jgi:EmrB/QacA subfamily drug resistance transporter